MLIHTCERCGCQFEMRKINVRFCSRECSGKGAPRKHGHSWSRTYRSWEAMKRRCQSVTSPDYGHYGARGIRVCEEWNDFTAFLLDMGERPDGTTLDRIDVNGNYTPNNCRWATAKRQAQNRRPKKFIRFEGKEWPVAELAIHLGIDRACLISRIKRNWPVERLAEATHSHAP